MIEKTIYNYLAAEMQPTKVYMEIPSNPPKSFVLIERTGGRKTNHILNATFAVQSYADSLLNACSLNEDVKTAMEKAVDDLDDIVSITVNSDYNYTDTTTKKYRYQAIFDIVHY